MAALQTSEIRATPLPPLEAYDAENFCGDLLIRLSAQCEVSTVHYRSKHWERSFEIHLQHGCVCLQF